MFSKFSKYSDQKKRTQNSDALLQSTHKENIK